MRRREFIISAFAAATLARGAGAQPKPKLARVGWVVGASAASSVPFLDGLRAGLADLGYVEGRNLAIETRYADDQPDRVAPLAEELVRLPVDILVTQGTATWTVVGLKSAVPVVFIFSADPVEAGFAQSLARPGGNATGLTLMSVELNGKRLELLREIMPATRRVAILANPHHRGEHLERRESEETAQRLGITIQYLPVRDLAELEASFEPIRSGSPQAIVVFPDPLVIQNRQRIIAFAMVQRIPVVSGWSIFAHSGALCTYGPRLTESYRRAAYYVDRIFKGAKAADLPIERPTKFELVINMNTAKALGLAMPPSLLARADEVIE
jgi:putative ABC transport system substrate-binding protein